MGTRERVAGLLARSGALAGVMRVRAALPVSTLSIVTYHHIAEQDGNYRFDPDVADANPAQFRRQLETLARYCNVVDIEAVIAAVHGEPLPPNPVLITFDDGYRSCHDTALPILKAVGLPATFFIATAFTTERRLFWWERIALVLSTTKVESATLSYPSALAVRPRTPDMRLVLTDLIKNTAGMDIRRFVDELTAALEIPWNDTIERAYADELIMTWDHVRAMAKAGMDIESHTRHHRVLQTLDDASLAEELRGSREDLAAQLGSPPRVIAYPVGRPIAGDPRLRKAVEDAGYVIGMSNQSGVNHMWPKQVRGVLPVDRLDIRRLSTDRTMSDAMFFGQVALPRLAYAARDGQR